MLRVAGVRGVALKQHKFLGCTYVHLWEATRTGSEVFQCITELISEHF